MKIKQGKGSLFLRVVCLGLLAGLMVGFRPFSSGQHWGITRTDTTLWVKFCDGFPTSFAEFKFPSGDALNGTTPDRDTVAASIFDDYNAIESSYLRLAPYPSDPADPADPGDSTFTKERAASRTITVCQGDPAGVSGGQAKILGSGSNWTGCEIKFADTSLHDASQFTGTLTHELGHCMGLAHPQDTVHAIMSYFRGTAIRLQEDDKMGLIFLYPMDDAQGQEEVTFGIMGCTPKIN